MNLNTIDSRPRWPRLWQVMVSSLLLDKRWCSALDTVGGQLTQSEDASLVVESLDHSSTPRVAGLAPALIFYDMDTFEDTACSATQLLNGLYCYFKDKEVIPHRDALVNLVNGPPKSVMN